MDLDIFLRRKNIERYRRLLDSSVESTERRTILNLLADEMKSLKKGDQQGCSRGSGNSMDIIQ
jgi:hypothetical protein